jgi:hypothetical protein
MNNVPEGKWAITGVVLVGVGMFVTLWIAISDNGAARQAEKDQTGYLQGLINSVQEQQAQDHKDTVNRIEGVHEFIHNGTMTNQRMDEWVDTTEGLNKVTGWQGEHTKDLSREYPNGWNGPQANSNTQ